MGISWESNLIYRDLMGYTQYGVIIAVTSLEILSRLMAVNLAGKSWHYL